MPFLKTLAKHKENESQRDDWHRGTRGTKETSEILKSFEKHRKAYQYPPELIQEPPGIIHDLTEPLFIRFRKTKASTKPRARTAGSRDLGGLIAE